MVISSPLSLNETLSGRLFRPTRRARRGSQWPLVLNRRPSTREKPGPVQSAGYGGHRPRAPCTGRSRHPDTRALCGDAVVQHRRRGHDPSPGGLEQLEIVSGTVRTHGQYRRGGEFCCLTHRGFPFSRAIKTSLDWQDPRVCTTANIFMQRRHSGQRGHPSPPILSRHPPQF